MPEPRYSLALNEATLIDDDGSTMAVVTLPPVTFGGTVLIGGYRSLRG